MVAANIFNNRQRTADKGWFSSLGLSEGLRTPRRNTPACYDLLYRASGLHRIFETTKAAENG
jgi:hypothetical protein